MKSIKNRQKEVERKIERIALFQGRRVTEIEQIIEENLDPVLPDKRGLFVDPVISFDSLKPEENFYDLEEVESFIEDTHRITEISEEKEDEEIRYHRGEFTGLADMESEEINPHDCYYSGILTFNASNKSKNRLGYPGFRGKPVEKTA